MCRIQGSGVGGGLWRRFEDHRWRLPHIRPHPHTPASVTPNLTETDKPHVVQLFPRYFFQPSPNSCQSPWK